MRGIAVILGTSVFGGIGWWLGAFVGTVTAFMLSTVGSGVGLYVVNKLWKEYMP